MRGTTVGEIFLENVKVNDAYLLGKIGQGVEIGDNAHYDARINMGAIAAGICQHALEIVFRIMLHKEKQLINRLLNCSQYKNKNCRNCNC